MSIFFEISGFIIAYVSLRSDLMPAIARSDFAYRRIVRIIPFLWLMAIAYNAVSAIGTHKVDWLPFLRVLTVWPVGALKPNVVWSLRHEFLFYGLFGVTMLGTRRRPWLLALWFVAPILLWPLLYAQGFTLSLTPDWPVELMSVTLLGAWTGANLQFGAGFLLGIALLRDHPAMRLRDFGLIWSVLAVLTIAVIAEAWALPIGLERSVVWTIMAAVPVWLSVVASARAGWLARIGTVLGDASFAVYLTHNMVILMMITAAKHFHPMPAPIPFLAAMVVAAVAAGIAAHYVIERPMIRWCRSRLETRRLSGRSMKR